MLIYITIDNNFENRYNVEYTRANGRVVKQTRTGNYPLVKDYGYDKNGQIETAAYTVGGRELSYTYETEHSPEKRNGRVTLPFAVEQNFAYDGLGRTREISLGENLVKDIYYQKFGDHARNSTCKYVDG